MIEELNMTFEDGKTIITQEMMNNFQNKINELVRNANAGGNVIHFDDPAVYQLILNNTNWVSNPAVGMTYEDASAVKSLNNVFSGNTDIVKFNELRYFDGLTELSANDFTGCTALEEITLPSSVTLLRYDSASDKATFSGCLSLKSIDLSNITNVIPTRCFQDCRALSSVIFPTSNFYTGLNCFYNCAFVNITTPNNATVMGKNCFAHNTKLESVDLGEMTTLNNNTFANCTALKTMTIRRTSSVVTYPSTTTLNLEHIYVPSSMVDSYKAANGWSNHASIIEAI